MPILVFYCQYLIDQMLSWKIILGSRWVTPDCSNIHARYPEGSLQNMAFAEKQYLILNDFYEWKNWPIYLNEEETRTQALTCLCKDDLESGNLNTKYEVLVPLPSGGQEV